MTEQTDDQLRAELAQQRALIKAAKRLDAVRRAHDDLLTYMALSMPDPEDPEDAERSLYVATPQAKLLCQIMAKVERREPGYKRVGISIGPQFGKSQVLTRGGPAWMQGRNPRLNVMVGAYNQDFANGFGDDVRALVTSSFHHQVFPNHRLRKGGQAKDELISNVGGKMSFVGIGGSGTGKPADVFLIDDPIRNDEDAQSPAYREKVWNWFTKVVNTRIRKHGAIVVVHTRWSEDDLLGRLCDPEHPERKTRYKGIADEWTYINIPAVIEDKKLADALGLTLEAQTDPLVVEMFGSKPIATLWPEQFDLQFLARQKQLDRRGFAALRMGQPAPEDGDYFHAADLIEYHSPDDVPTSVNVYGASDHAVSTKQVADKTVIGCVAVDSRDDIWVLPDLFWERVETDDTVDELLRQFRLHRPLLWWMESELISKSFGPFLRKRMAEEKTYVAIDAVGVSKDKPTRARSIQGRVRMRKVHFPAFAPWWPAMRHEILKFPYGTHDDAVDWLAHIGQGLEKEVGGRESLPEVDNIIRVGSIGWILRQSKLKATREARQKNVAGW